MTLVPPRTVPVFCLVLFALLLWGGEYARRDLWEPDEARYALVSREMRDGHWLVPFRQGEFYSHKPPLMFWLTNLFSLPLGGHIGRIAPRMPSLLGALFSLWVASRLATRWFSSRAGWVTVPLLATSFLFWNKGGFGQIDMLLCGLEMMALYFFFTAEERPARARWWPAYAFMGLGILAKGPVGFLVPWGIYFTSRLVARPPRGRPRSHWFWGPLVALAFPGLWLGLAWWQGAPEGYFRELLFQQNVGRMAGEFGGHVKPFYYFLYYFPLDFLPWTLLLPLAAAAHRHLPQHRAAQWRLVGWILFVVVFFSLSASKRNLYILSAYPAAAILVAASVEGWPSLSRNWLKYSFSALWILMLVLGLGLSIGSLLHHWPHVTGMMLPAGITLLAGCWWSLEAWRQGPAAPQWLGAAAASLAVTFAMVGALVYPEYNAHKTPTELVAPAQKWLKPEERLVAFQQNGEIYSYYAQRKGYMANSPEELARFLREAPQEHHLIVADERSLPALYTVIDPATPAHRFRMGGKKLAYVELTGPSTP